MSTLRREVPRAFVPLLQPARYKGAYGGRGGAKSHFFAEQLLIRAYSKSTRAVFIREVQKSLKDSVRQLLIDKIGILGMSKHYRVLDDEIRGANGSLIIFRGMQDYSAESIKSLEGFDIAWVEEAQTLSARSLRMLRPTIRNAGSEIWASWNPRNKHDPVDEFFRGPTKHPEAIAVQVGWQDNPWLPDELKREKDHDYMVDPVTAQHVWGGDYEVVAKGAYYARLIVRAEEEQRVSRVVWEPRLPVHTAWDLGMDDYTAIWFVQQHYNEVRVIDYYENSGTGLAHYVAQLRANHRAEWTYGQHFLPHDAEVRELGTGMSRVEVLKSLGVRPKVVKKLSVEDGIEAVRNLLPRCWFDKQHCERGIDALRLYRSEWDERTNQAKPRPLHDWTSHGADAFRYLAISLKEDKPLEVVNEHQQYFQDPDQSTYWGE